MRDEFTHRTKEKLAHRAGYVCSKPDCRITTRGAASDPEKTINLGEAAHITAASPGGPRYDGALSPEQRRDQSNGIWLCATHAKLVDSDENSFSVEELRRWKRIAEQRSFVDVVTAASRARHPSGAENETVAGGLFQAVRADLASFQRTHEWPSQPVALNLRLVNENNSKVFDVRGIVAALAAFEEFAVIAPPGTGKTTTLLQLAGAILEDSAAAAIFIPLSEWATTGASFREFLSRRLAFRDVDILQLQQLAREEKLALLLDGWNELDEGARRFIAAEIRWIQRNLPGTRLIVSSRHKDYDLPIAGQLVEITPLTDGQQLAIARALRGDDGELVVEHARRTTGLRELVSIPLYLSVLLKHAQGPALPTTKEDLLRTFVKQHEEDPEKRPILRGELEDRHQDILIALAVEAMRRQTTTLSDECARSVVGREQDRLRAAHQIAQAVTPLRALDVLVGAHLLMRVGDTFFFQHQQFQEWYVSLWIERLMTSALSGDSECQRSLIEDVLNWPIWEEAVLFACERMSRAGDLGAEMVSKLTLEALGIDPLLSAEIIYRSSPNVWGRVRSGVIDFATRWHQRGHVDRAVSFMINTGRPEFSDYVWPLVADPDTQVHLPALRAGRRFRITVLGSAVAARIADLGEELRSHVASEIVLAGGVEGIQLASRVALEDKSPLVKFAVIDALMFRRAERFMAPILETGPTELWTKLAAKWRPDEFTDPTLAARVADEAQRFYEREKDPLNRLLRLVERRPREHETAAGVRALIEEMDFAGTHKDGAWILYKAYELFPDDVARGLVSQLERGRAIPFGSSDMLRASKITLQDGPLVDRLLGASASNSETSAIAAVAGPSVIGKLIDRLIKVSADLTSIEPSGRKKLGDEYHWLVDAVAKARITAFSDAVLERAGSRTPDSISLLAELIARFGKDPESSRLNLDAEMHQRMTTVVATWGATLLVEPGTSRAQLACIARAAERLGSPSLVPVLQQLLTEELTRWHRARQELTNARGRNGPIPNDAHMSWTLQYRRAFAAIGDGETVRIMKTYLPDHAFGVEAAHVLSSIWRKSQPTVDADQKYRPSPDFSEARTKRIRRASEPSPSTFPFVDDILAVVADLIQPGSRDDEQQHALRLATVAFGMPYSGKDAIITALLTLPLPPATKVSLLTTLAMAGETLPSALVLSGIDQLFEDAKTKPWLLQDQEGWRVKEWLRLLPFSDNPIAVLDVLPRLTPHHTAPWSLRGLLSALGWSPSSDAEEVLHELAIRDPRFVREHDWISALSSRNTLSAARILLDVVCAADTLKVNGHMGFRRELAWMMDAHPPIRSEIYQRYVQLPDGPAKAFIELAIAEAADVEGTLLMVRTIAARGTQPHASPLYTALRHVLVGERSSLEMPGMQELYSLPASKLRKELLGLVLSGTPGESKVAGQCLAAVDEIRDDYGRLESEPRHPDITTGVPWPQLELLAAT